VINPLWAVILEKVEKAWRSTGSISHPPSPSSLPQAQWGIALFAHLRLPERRAQAPLGENVEWTETRIVLEDKTVERLLSERDDTQATHVER